MSSRILIVDDEPNILRMLSYTLEHEGYDVAVAKSGSEAFSDIVSVKPDLVILDVMLPDMTGIDICLRLRNQPETTNLPIIMLSAKVQVPDRIRGLEAGADEYVTKPVDPSEMVARVKYLLERTHRLSQSQTKTKKAGKVLAFMGAKGGVGTTTVAINVALSLLNMSHSVTAVEFSETFDSFPHHLNTIREGDLGKLLAGSPHQPALHNVKQSLVSHPSGLKLLFGLCHSETAKEIGLEQVEALLRQVKQLADYIILDLPSYPLEFTSDVLRQCDRVTVVAEKEPLSLAAAKEALHKIKAWGFGSPATGVVLTNLVRWANPLSLPDIESALGSPILGVIPPAPELCRQALVHQTPLVLSHTQTTVTTSFKDLAVNFAEEKKFATVPI